MEKFNYTVTDPLGIHARPAGLLVKKAAEYDSQITIEKDGKTGDAKKIFSVMGLGIKTGETITVTAEGRDEAEAANAVKEFLKANL
ncbi:MAG: HPr family phosphocarrier protein [Oscillospiraceae bacterium]|nr:HPr family phosphocarrier protein [Oscillospiraceae bacterium]